MVFGIGGHNLRFEYRARFARIGINRKIENIRRKPPEIDHTILDRLKLIGSLGAIFRFVVITIFELGELLSRRKDQIDGLFDVVLNRLERHHTGLPDPRREHARDMHPAPPSGLTSNTARAERISRRPAISAIAARVVASASSSSDSPIFGICATINTARHGSATSVLFTALHPG